MTLDALRKFFTSGHVKSLEEEVRYLRGQVNMLTHVLVTPPVPAPATSRTFPKFAPARTSWESYLAEQIALQEKEADGISSK